MHTTGCVRASDAQVVNDEHRTRLKVRRKVGLRIVQLYLQHAMSKIVRPISC